MKYKFSRRSGQRLATVDTKLQRVMEAALETGLIDISIIQGVRSKQEQNRYFDLGKSRVKWPNGKHNVYSPDEKALAVDAAPFVNGNISWDPRHCIFLAGVVMSTAAKMGITLRWGGNWNMDGEPVTGQDFQDLVHFELM